jgi:hypothetical protein
MLIQRWFRLTRESIRYGLLLAGLNVLLCVMWILIPFAGGPLLARVLPRSYVALTGMALWCFFPFWGCVGLGAWASYGWRLARSGLQFGAILPAALIGALPLLSLAGLGYAVVAYVAFLMAVGAPDPAGMLPTSGMVYGGLATLILLFGAACVAVTSLSGVLLPRLGRRVTTS